MFSDKQLKRLIMPLVIEQTLALSMGMVAMIMVSSAGESAVSGISLVDTVNALLINLFSSFATGGAIVAGQYLGKGDRENSRSAARQLVVLATAVALCIMIVCLLLNPYILTLVYGNIDDVVMTNARIYFYITALSYPFMALYNVSAALFRGMGNTRISMINAFIMNIVNILVSGILIYGFQLGVLGAAIATLLSRFFAATSMIIMLRNINLPIYVRSYSLRDIDFTMVKRIMRIGIPNGIENSMFQMGKIIVAGLVSIQGTAAIAANAVSFSITSIAMIPGSAMGLAMTTVIAQCIGAGEYKQADKYMKYFLRLAYIFTIMMNIAIILALNPILSVFNLTSETSVIAKELLILHGISAIIIWPLSFSLPNGFRAAGDVKFTMVVAMLSMWVFRIGVSYMMVYVFNMGVLGVWIAMITDWLFRSICFTIRWLSGKWKKLAIV